MLLRFCSQKTEQKTSPLRQFNRQMQKGNSSDNCSIKAAISSPFQSRASPVRRGSNECHFNFFSLANGAASIASSKETMSNAESVPLTPSCSCDEENSTESHLYMLQSYTRLTLQYQEMAERYGLCLAHLRETAKEAVALREENARLRTANMELSKRLSLLSVTGKTPSSLNNYFVSSGFPAMPVLNDLRRRCIGDGGENSRIPVEMPDNSPTSVLSFDENGFQKQNSSRIAVPKSISIRSSGFLKVNQAGGNTRSPSRPNRPRVATGVAGSKVYVPRGKKDEEAVEVEVYNQGMLKTELCNKWQETGTCPYGDHCQFAHGIDELRPVLRHPRYKTEVCRMVIAGDTCPYGHRCHFRHALTEQERGSSRPF